MAPGYATRASSGLLAGSAIAETLAEPLYPTTGIENFLLTGIERMAGGADVEVNILTKR